MKGRNGSTSFLPSKRKGGFQRETPFEQCLTKDQTKHIYDKIETGKRLELENWFSRILLTHQSRGHVQTMLISMKRLY